MMISVDAPNHYEVLEWARTATPDRSEPLIADSFIKCTPTREVRMLCSARYKLRMKLCPILTHTQCTTVSSGLAQPARDSTTTLPGGEEWTMTLQQADVDESHLRPAARGILRPATRTTA